MKKATLLFITSLMVLVACSPKEKTITVPEFMQDKALTKETVAWCKENPAERNDLANCINAFTANDEVIAFCAPRYKNRPLHQYCPKKN